MIALYARLDRQIGEALWRGQALGEYALLLVLVCAVGVLALGLLGSEIAQPVSEVASKIHHAHPPHPPHPTHTPLH
jgi:hypothetical protein